MQLLLDTHIFLWFAENNPSLSRKACKLIAEADEVYISSASIWEIAIKMGLGKIKVDLHQLVTSISENHFLELPISAREAALVAKLPPIHRDPFDRLLIAQSLHKQLQLLTADKVLLEYSNMGHVIKV